MTLIAFNYRATRLSSTEAIPHTAPNVNATIATYPKCSEIAEGGENQSPVTWKEATPAPIAAAPAAIKGVFHFGDVIDVTSALLRNPLRHHLEIL
jgi:hypothetical protein